MKLLERLRDTRFNGLVVAAGALVAIVLLLLVASRGSSPDDWRKPVAELLAELRQNNTTLRSELDDYRQRLAVLEQSASETAAGFADIQADVTALNDLAAAFRDEFDTTTRQCRSGLAELDRFRETLDRLNTRVSAPRPPAQVAAKPRPRAPRPSLNLVAIDHWGGVDQAVIRFNGRLHPLSREDRINGWSLNAIDANRRQATLIDAEGRTIVLNQE